MHPHRVSTGRLGWVTLAGKADDFDIVLKAQAWGATESNLNQALEIPFLLWSLQVNSDIWPRLKICCVSAVSCLTINRRWEGPGVFFCRFVLPSRTLPPKAQRRDSGPTKAQWSRLLCSVPVVDARIEESRFTLAYKMFLLAVAFLAFLADAEASLIFGAAPNRTFGYGEN